MNKLIAKLYDQAIILEDNSDYVTGELDPFKFAELIVRECAGLCDKAAEENARIFYTINETQEVIPALILKGAQLQAEKLSRQIKQHFGGGK